MLRNRGIKGKGGNVSKWRFKKQNKMINAEDFFDFLNFSKLFQDILCLKCCLSCHKEHLQPTSTRFLVFTETRPNS